MSATLTTFGDLLKSWRSSKRVTQEELGFRANLSAKHVSFLETGRAQPSKDAILAIGSALGIPLREVNVLLASAGLGAHYLESNLESPMLESVRSAIAHMLDKHMPYPAWVVDGKFDVIALNGSALSMNKIIRDDCDGFPTVDPFFHPNGLRRCLSNWEDVATMMLRRMQREILLGKKTLLATFERVMSYPGIPTNWQRRTPSLTIEPTVYLDLVLRGKRLRFLTVLSTFGSSVDPFVEELTVESCFPTDSETVEFCKTLSTTSFE